MALTIKQAIATQVSLAYLGRPQDVGALTTFSFGMTAEATPSPTAAQLAALFATTESKSIFGVSATMSSVVSKSFELVGRVATAQNLTDILTWANDSKLDISQLPWEILKIAMATESQLPQASQVVWARLSVAYQLAEDISGSATALQSLATSTTQQGALRDVISGVTSFATIATAYPATGSGTAANFVSGSASSSGQTFTLTTGVDNIPGGSGNDTITGVIANTAAANSVGTTFQAGDIINGGLGIDTLSISVAGGFAGTNAAVTLNSIERVMVSNVNAAAQSISLSLADSDLTTVGHLSSNTAGVTTFTGVRKIVAAELANGDGGVTVTYDATVVAGTADAMSLTLANQTGGTFTTNGIETLNVVSNTIANTVTLAAGPTTVNVSGNARLTLGALDVGITTLNASANTGGLVATLSSTATAVITGSSAADTITAGTNMTGVGAVNAGAGIDTLVSTANALIATAADGARFTNFEILSVSTTNLVNGAQTRAQDMSLISGINTVNVTSARVDGQADNATHGVTLSNLAATTNTLNITGLANADTTVGVDGLDVTVTATRALNTAADAITVNLGTATATVGTTGTATGGTAAGAVTLALSLANEESITLNSLGGTTGTNFLAGITNTAATSVTATGARDLSFASMSSQVVTSINASAMTGAFIMGTNAGAVASTISGGTGADTLIGGSAADNISGGAGNDSIVGGAGNDVISGGDGADTINGGAGIDNLSGGDGSDTFLVTTTTDFIGLASAETVSGGAGTDNLSFVENVAITIAAADLLGINSIERITINGTGNAGSITLTDAVYTANGATTLSIVDGALTTGTLTVNASALTAANSVQITANTTTGVNDTLTGGAGNDTFIFSTVAGLQATDTVVGGAGTDTISLTTATGVDVTAVMTGVRTVERVITTGTAGDASITVGSDDVIAANATLTVDASSITNSAFDLDYTGVAIVTATKSQNVTGTAGNDTIVGGSGNDIIVGGDGNDVITGGAGIDNLSGGAGNDTFVVAALGAGFVGLTTAETVSGGAGNDTLQFAADTLVIAASDLIAVSGIENIEIQNTTQTASLTLTDAFYTTNGATTLAVNASTATTGVLTLAASTLSAANSVQLNMSATTNNAAHVINLGAGNDTVTVDMIALDAGTIAGGAGTDTLVIAANTGNGAITAAAAITGFEIINFTSVGGTYNLTVNEANVAVGITQTVNASNLTTGTLTFNGAAETNGKFSITGGAGADSLTGGSLADTIIGGAGADVITGGLGADVLTGGIGADTFVYTAVAQSNGTNTDTITDFASGADKLRVTLDYSTLTTALDINAVRSSAGVAGTSLAQDTLSGQRGQYVYDTSSSSLFINVNADNLLTTADYKIGINPASTATATIVDGDIDFVITGGTNADIIVAGGGADLISGGAGNDLITGGAGADTILGGTGVDTLLGGAGADVFEFLAGDSDAIVAAGDGNDTGTDNINDFATGDRIKLTITSADTVFDVGTHILVGTAGTGATNTAIGAAASYAATAYLVQLGNPATTTDGFDIVVNVTTNGTTAAFADAAAAQAATIVDVSGTAAADTIIGGAGDDIIRGLGGADTKLEGLAGNDTIIGGEGADTISGGAGLDLIDLTETVAASDVVHLGSTDVAGTDLALAAGNADTIIGFLAGGTAGDILKFDIGTIVVSSDTEKVATLSGTTFTSLANTATATDTDVLIVLGTFASYAAVQVVAEATVTDATNGQIVAFQDTSGNVQVVFDSNGGGAAGTVTLLATLIGVQSANLVAGNFDVIA